MNKYLSIAFSIVLFLTVLASVHGQGRPNVTHSDKYKVYTDSLKNTPYPWRMPIMGAKLRALGFDLPYPNGIMATYALSKQQIVINDLTVGLDPDKVINADGIARFNSLVSTVQGEILRYDFWLLPFLNISVLGGHIHSETRVDLGLPFEAVFNANNSGYNVGWGALFSGAVGPFAFTTDFTQNWTFMPNLDQPARGILFDGRLGYMIRFKNKPDMNLVVLAGAQMLRLNPESSGRAPLEAATGISQEDKQQAAEQLTDWYDELPSNEQDLFGGLYNKMYNYLTNGEEGYIYYSFKKKLYYPWSMTLGANYQLNHRFQFTFMYTFLGSREQFSLGVNYRFGIRGKNILHGVTF